MVQGKCIDNKYLQQVFTSVISTQVQNYYGTVPKYDSQYEKVVNCPA